MKNTIRFTFVAIPALLLSNCATIFGGGSPNNVGLNSSPSGATVVVKKSSGEEIYRGVTPATVTLARHEGYFKPAKYIATFSKRGYPAQTVAMNANMNPWYAGNLVFGGLLGLLIVDPLTGAMWTLDKEYTAQLGHAATAQADTGGSLRIYDRASIPKEWEAHLVAVR